MYFGRKVMSRCPVFSCVDTALIECSRFGPDTDSITRPAQASSIGGPKHKQKAVLAAAVSIVCRALLRPWPMPTKYRKFARGDVAAAHRLSAEAGWPHRVEDWQFVQQLGSGHVA